MAPKRTRKSNRPVPYDPELLENWTIARLKGELRRLNVDFREGSKRMILVQKLKDARARSHNAQEMEGARSHDAIEQHGGAHRSIPIVSNQSLVELVSTLAESVHTLQDCYSRLENRLNNVPERVLQQQQSVPAAAAGSVSQQATDAFSVDPALPSSNRSTLPEFTLESAYRRFQEQSSTSTGEQPHTRTRFGYASESLPLVETVSPSLRQQIITGKDVNLAALLIPYFHGQSDPSCHQSEKPDARLNRTLSLQEFILAFGVYKQVMCNAHPHRRIELDLYERDIVEMGTRYNHGFYEYHKQFALKAAAQLRYNNILIDWSVRDNTLFCNIFANQRPNTCSLCNSTLHTTNFCPRSTTDQRHISGTSKNRNMNTQGVSDSRGRPRVYHEGQEICNNFNGHSNCNSSNCNFLHVCLVCKGSHKKINCPLDGTQTQNKKK